MWRIKLETRNDGITLLDGQEIRGIDKNGYKYFVVFVTDKMKEGKMKKTIQEYEQRSMLVLRSKCNVPNKTMIINSWVVAVLRYRTRIIKLPKQ